MADENWIFLDDAPAGIRGHTFYKQHLRNRAALFAELGQPHMSYLRKAGVIDGSGNFITRAKEERVPPSVAAVAVDRKTFAAEFAKRFLAELNAAETLLASRKRIVSGTLRINLPISFGRLCVMPVLKEVADGNPDLNLDISFTDRQVDLVEEGVDLVVRLGDPGDHASLIGRRIGTQRSIICAAPTYLDRRGRPAFVEELVDHDYLAFAKDGRPLPWAISGPGGAVRPFVIPPRHTISHGEALRDATVNGLGVAYLSTWLAADELRSGRLEVVPIATPAEDVPITALWPRSRDLAPKVRVVVDALVKAFMPTRLNAS